MVYFLALLLFYCMRIMSNVRVYAACFAVSLQSMSVGIATGWTSPMLPWLMSEDSLIHVNPTQASWLASLLKVSSACSCLAAFIVADILGRKVTILIALVPNTLSWLLMAWATTVSELYISRILIGISDGMLMVCGSMYVSEIALPRSRGTLVSNSMIALFSGNLLGYMIGYLGSMSYYACTALILLFLHFLMFVWCPETPYHLIRYKRYDECKKTLVFLRCTTDVKEEMDSIMRSVESDSNRVHGKTKIFWSLWDLISRPGGKRIIGVALVLSLMNALSGSYVLINYAQSIFAEIDGIREEASYLAVCLGLVFLLGNILARLLADCVGRKPMIIISTFGSASATLAVGTYFYFQNIGYDDSRLHWIPIIGLMSYVFLAACGVDALSMLMLNEIVPTYARAVSLSICLCISYSTISVLLNLWLPITERYGIYTCFWVLSIFSFINFIIETFFSNETKRHTWQQIQDSILYHKNF